MTTDAIKKNILVVDDDEAQLFMIKVLLADEFDVATAKSGKEALDLIYKGLVPDLVLLDIMMPEMDGWETFNRMRAISFLHKAPIIIITSFGGEPEKKKAEALGAADFIMKPLSKNDLLGRISRVLNP